jgi:hypothetical protein
MIQEYVRDIAAKMGVTLSTVTVVDGREVGCLSVHLLHLACGNHLVSALVHQSELDDLLKDSSCERLELKIRIALTQLRIKSEVNS